MSLTSKEMVQLRDRIQEERINHFSGIESTDLSQLKEMRRKCYVPRQKTKEELLREIKYKKSWKGSGIGNEFFMKPPVMRPKMLDPWTAGRVQQPERAYTKFFFMDKKPFRYTKSICDKFE